MIGQVNASSSGHKYTFSSQIVLIFFSALLLGAASPNMIFATGSSIAGVCSLIPLLMVLYHETRRKRQMLLGITFALFSTPALYYWLALYQKFSFWSLAGPTVGYIFYFFLLFPFIADISKGPWRPVHIALYWTVFEFFKSSGFLGFPWGLLANVGNNHLVLAQIADTTGMWGIGFLFAWVNAVGTEILLNRSLREWKHIALITSVFVIITGYGVFRLYTHPTEETKRLQAVVIQPDINPWEESGQEQISLSLEKGQILTQKALSSHKGPVDVIIWPETFLRIPFQEGFFEYYEALPSSSPFMTFLSSLPAPLITGVPYLSEEGDFYNAAIVIDTLQKRVTDTYTKFHLVPGAETIPGWDVPAIQKFFRNVVGITSMWEAGLFTAPLTLPTDQGSISVGLVICFEDTFPYISRKMTRQGADILVSISNNSWAGNSTPLVQQYSSAVFRTIENRRSMLRLGNNGLTQVIDSRGIIVDSLPTLQSSSKVMSIPIYEMSGYTVYQIIGDSFAWVLVAGVFLIIVYRKITKT